MRLACLAACGLLVTALWLLLCATRPLHYGASFFDPQAISLPELLHGSSGATAVGQRVVDAAVGAAELAPPSFQPLPDALPQRLWQPVWKGVGTFYTDRPCVAHQPAPRLWTNSLNDLLFTRSLEIGRTNLVEPTSARQTLTQLCSVGFRSKKDAYTRATMTNDLSDPVCAQLRRGEPTQAFV